MSLGRITPPTQQMKGIILISNPTECPTACYSYLNNLFSGCIIKPHADTNYITGRDDVSNTAFQVNRLWSRGSINILGRTAHLLTPSTGRKSNLSDLQNINKTITKQLIIITEACRYFDYNISIHLLSNTNPSELKIVVD